MSNDKVMNGISKKKLWKALKQKRQGGKPDQVVRSHQKNESNRSTGWKKCKFYRRIYKPRK